MIVVARRMIGLEGEVPEARPSHLPSHAVGYDQQRIVNRLGIEPPPVHAPQQLVARIDTFGSSPPATRLPIGGTRNDQPVQFLKRLALVSKTERKPVEELRMRRLGSHFSEVVERRNDAATKVIVPNPVDDRTPDQRVLPIGQPPRQRGPPRALLCEVALHGRVQFRQDRRRTRFEFRSDRRPDVASIQSPYGADLPASRYEIRRAIEIGCQNECLGTLHQFAKLGLVSSDRLLQLRRGVVRFRPVITPRLLPRLLQRIERSAGLCQLPHQLATEDIVFGIDQSVRTVDSGENTLQPVIVLLPERIERMVMAPRTLDGRTGKDVHHGGQHFVPVEVPDAALLHRAVGDFDLTHEIEGPGRHEAGRHDRVARIGKEHVARDLFEHETAIRSIVVQGADDIIAVTPGVRAHLVLVETVRVGVAGDIEPVSSPSFAVAGRSEQSVDDSLVGVGPFVMHEVGDLAR